MYNNLTAGFAMTGSFCTFKKVIPEIDNLVKKGADIIPIMSNTAATTDTRFGKAKDFVNTLIKITGNPVISAITDAEPIGPKKLLDILIVAPCTGNSLAKLAGGVADTAVTLAVKAHLRNNRPVVIGISSNDGLGANASNIGMLLNRKNIFMIPFSQDDCIEKEKSLVADFSLTEDTINMALRGKQLQPMLI